MKQLLKIDHNPKVLELEKLEDGQVRMVITLSKLGQMTKLDFLLGPEETHLVSQVLAM